MKVAREDALQMFKDLGMKVPPNVTDSQILGKLNKLPEMIEKKKIKENAKTQESQDLLTTIVTNIEAGDKIEVVAEVKKRSSKKKDEPAEGKKRKSPTRKEGSAPSNKEVVYKAWQKASDKQKADKEFPKKMVELVNNNVQLVTVRSWLGQWKNGKNLPACAKS